MPFPPRLLRRSATHPSSLATRARAWCLQFELDRELAQGVDPARSPALRARAEQLTSEHFRRELLAQLDGALAKAHHPPHWHSPGLPVRGDHVRAATVSLQALRAALHSPTPPRVQGAALAACLLNDPDGPLYRPATEGTIARLADAATSALSTPPRSPDAC